MKSWLLLAMLISGLSIPQRLAAAETIDVNDSHGGSVAAYNARWAGLAARGGLTEDFKWMRAPDTYRYFRKC